MLLSICIPSYNRINELKKIVSELCKAQSYDFEIVIVDNASDYNVAEQLDCKDKRLRIIQRKKSVGGFINTRDCLSYARGRFCFLCLDKDFIIAKMLDDFILCLKKNENVTCARCELNYDGIESYTIIKKNLLLKYGYRDWHPSGLVFSKAIVDYDSIKGKKYIDDPFGYIMLFARCLSEGDMLFYKKHMVLMESSKNADNIKSFSLSGDRGNVFFMPHNRIEQMATYLEHLNSLKLDYKYYVKVIQSIYNITLEEITWKYKNLMRNKVVCSHYRINTECITIKNIINNVFLLQKNFFRVKEINISKLKKLSIITNGYKFLLQEIIIHML